MLATTVLNERNFFFLGCTNDRIGLASDIIGAGPATSALECQQSCLADVNCLSWTYVPAFGFCYLFNSVATTFICTDAFGPGAICVSGVQSCVPT